MKWQNYTYRIFVLHSRKPIIKYCKKKKNASGRDSIGKIMQFHITWRSANQILI